MDVGRRVDEGGARAFVQSLGPTRPALGGQLLVGDRAAGWILQPPEARLARPDRIEWVAARPYRERGHDFEFMPPEVTRDHTPPIHAFVNVPGADDFAYAGEADPGAYGYMSAASAGEVTLYLRRRLPWETWLLLGGKPGFSVSGAGDGLSPEAVEQEIGRRLAQGEGEICIQGFSEPSLTLLLNRRRAFVMYLRHDGDAGAVAADAGAEGDRTPEYFALGNGQRDEFERSRTVTHPQALSCVRAFVRERPLSSEVLWLED